MAWEMPSDKEYNVHLLLFLLKSRSFLSVHISSARHKKYDEGREKSYKIRGFPPQKEATVFPSGTGSILPSFKNKSCECRPSFVKTTVGSYSRAFDDGLIIFNQGQVMRTTPELEHPSPNFHTTTTGGRLNLDIFKVRRPHQHSGS
ncbi:hypothetical protein TNCV_164211 [Trichonephila clavipes]|nr:hypothetical protein TNCV_164211 [Trichonephila clavipes]